MGIITKVERAPKQPGRYHVFIDEVFAFSVHEDVMIRHRLMKGETVDEAAAEAIAGEDEQHKAYLYCLKLLSSRLRSEAELIQKMKLKGYSEEAYNGAVQRLSQEKYIDDALFAQQLTHQRIHSQKKGRLWIKQELKSKGISKEEIAEATSSIDEETEYQLAYALAAKRYRPADDREQEEKQRRRLAGWLLRRGYASGLVSRVLRDLFQAAGLSASTEELEHWADSESD